MVILDDIGSFPLPSYTSREYFNDMYWDAWEGTRKGYDISQNAAIKTNVIHPIENIYEIKSSTGFDILTYPQIMDMYTQFTYPIKKYQDKSNPYLIAIEDAQLLEVNILKEWAKRRYEVTQTQYKLKVCVTGPVELYFHLIGFEVYDDLAMNFARSINKFLKNSILNEKYIKTEVVAIDEPSLGFVPISNTSDDELIRIYDKSTEGIDVDVQVHLHSLNQFKIPIQTKNINILTCEFASNHQNKIDKKYLDASDKFMRVGICRTNINSIMSNALDSGNLNLDSDPVAGMFSLIDSKEQIKHNYELSQKLYGDRLKYVGPDCGLSAWEPPIVAAELLKRTSDVVKNIN